MAGAAINAELERLIRADSDLAHAFIVAGRGHEKPSEYLLKNDPLSRRARMIYDRRHALRAEVEFRSAYAIWAAEMEKGGKIPRRRRNPGFQGPSQWYIHIQRYAGNRGIGPVMLYNGKSFSDRPDSRPYGFSSKTAAASMARRLVTNNRKLAPYKVWVAPALYGQATVDRAVNPKRRKNPSAPGLDEAAHKLEEFTGRPAGDIIESTPRSKDKTGLVIGELDLIGYRQAREGIDGGRMTRFAHKFRKNSRPLLAVSTDGKQLHIVGGQYEFTDAGIEDR